MENPGIYNLGDVAVTTAVAGEVITDGTSASGEDQAFIDRLEGASEIDVQMKFLWGSGGTSFKGWFQTSLDQGTTWIDLWCFTATTASKTRARRLKPDGNEVTPSDGALADDTVAAGIVFGDRFRVKRTNTGTYAGNTSFSARASAR